MGSRRVKVFLLAIIVVFTAAGCGSLFGHHAGQDRGSHSAQHNASSEQLKKPEAPSELANSNLETGSARRAVVHSEPGTYSIDASQSRITAEVDVGTLLSAIAHDHVIAIPDLSGEAHLVPGSLDHASLEMNIRADSLVETGRDFGDKDREGVNRAVREKALETTLYPEIRFNSTNITMKPLGEGIYQANITGLLTLHGVTRSISFPAQVKIDQSGLRATGQFKVLHRDYNIKQLTAGAGVLTARDPIILSFDILAQAI